VPLDLETELDRLYAAELADFVGERKGIAGALKQEGRKAEAARVEELRKPSVPAWTVNQLARRKRKDLDALITAGEELGEAQQALLAGGGRAAFAEARRREQAALRQLRVDAAWILGKRASDATLDRVVSTLGAAAVTAEGRAQLVEARLVADVAPQGFDAFAAVAPGEVPAKKPARPKAAAREAAPDRRKARQEAVARARETLAAAREHETELAEERRRAERAAGEARKVFDAAERKAERLRTQHEEAAGAVASARLELEAAKKS
jgi:hypothetical protein